MKLLFEAWNSYLEEAADPCWDGYKKVGMKKKGDKMVPNCVPLEEEVIEEEETYDVEEDVQALLEGEELSEEFQDKARTIFETAIKSKVGEIKEELNEAYAAALVEELETIKFSVKSENDRILKDKLKLK